LSAKPNGLTWAELANLRSPKTWTRLKHGNTERPHTLRDRLAMAEDAGLVRYEPRSREWSLTPKGLALVTKDAA
jgi:hypothetical protein